MTATVDATIASTQGDGGRDGKGFITPAGMSGKRVLVHVGSSSNADTIGTPGAGTWSQVTLPDNLVTTSGGQYRVYEGSGLADSTAYDFTLSGGRRTVVAQVISGFDASGGSMVDVASSLESAAGSTHALPSGVTPAASGELAISALMFRHFAPDTSTGSPPSSGLAWTEDADVRGLDSNNNIQVNVAHATAGAGAIPTTPWNTDDPFEPALVTLILIRSAGGGSGAAPAGLSVPVSLGSPTVALGTSAAPSGLAVPVALGGPSATRQSAAPAGLLVPVSLGAPAVTRAGAAPAGLSVPVSLGAPAVTAGAFPAGLAVSLAFGAPAVARPGAAPAGLPVAVSLGAPTATLGRSAAPGGLAVPVSLGAPQAGAQAPYVTAVLTPGALASASLTPGAVAAAALTPSTVAPATLITGNL